MKGGQCVSLFEELLALASGLIGEGKRVYSSKIHLVCGALAKHLLGKVTRTHASAPGMTECEGENINQTSHFTIVQKLVHQRHRRVRRRAGPPSAMDATIVTFRDCGFEERKRGEGG